MDKLNTSQPPLFVIGVGVGRTGTKSLKLALEMLYQQPCYHMFEVLFTHPEHVKLWTELYRLVEADPGTELPANRVREIFKGYANSTDHPACSIYKQLMRIYPNAKFILTIRDAKSWIESVRATIGPRTSMFGSGWFGHVLQRLALPSGFHAMTELSWRLALGHTVDVSDEQMMESFRRRIADVQRTVPPDRLLVFNVREGWLPLCKFLNRPIPDQLFPHVNDRKELKRRIAWMERKVEIYAVLCITLIALIAALILHWFVK